MRTISTSTKHEITNNEYCNWACNTEGGIPMKLQHKIL